MSVGYQYSLQYVVALTLLSMFSIVVISQIRYAERVDIIKTGFNIGLAGLVNCSCNLYFGKMSYRS